MDVRTGWRAAVVVGGLSGLATSCGPSVMVPADGDGSGTTSSGTGTASASVSATAATTLTDPDGTTTGPMPSTSGSTASVDDTTSGGGLCEPGGGDVTAYLDLVHANKSFEDIDLDEVCMVGSGGGGTPTQLDLDIDCPSGQFELSISADPFPPLMAELTPGTPIYVRALRNFPIDYGGYRHIVIRTLDSEIIAAGYGYGAPGGVDLTTLFAPLSYGLATDLCPIVPFEDDTNFITEPCSGDEEVIAIDFDDGNRQIRIYDGGVDTLGPLEIRVNYAVRTYTMDDRCGTEGVYDNLSWTALRVQ